MVLLFFEFYLLQSLNAVKQWVRHYKDEGIDGLKEKQRSGRPSKARNQNHTKPLNPKMKPLTPKKSMNMYQLNHKPYIRSFRIMQVLNNEKIFVSLGG
jgi:hypothetical protein